MQHSTDRCKNLFRVHYIIPIPVLYFTLHTSSISLYLCILFSLLYAPMLYFSMSVLCFHSILLSYIFLHLYSIFTLLYSTIFFLRVYSIFTIHHLYYFTLALYCSTQLNSVTLYSTKQIFLQHNTIIVIDCLTVQNHYNVLQCNSILQQYSVLSYIITQPVRSTTPKHCCTALFNFIFNCSIVNYTIVFYTILDNCIVSHSILSFHNFSYVHIVRFSSMRYQNISRNIILYCSPFYYIVCLLQHTASLYHTILHFNS